MAVDFGLRKMKVYLVGNPQVTVVTDHKPLVAIFRGTRPGSMRSERIILRHQDISYSVVWKQGKENPADFFSRRASPFNDLSKEELETTAEMEKLIYMVLNGDVNQTSNPKNIAEATRQDNNLKKAINHGVLPNTQTLGRFSRLFSELTVSSEGNVLRGNQLVLSKGIVQQALDLAHGGGHLGTSSMKRRLCAVSWFPGMNHAIESHVLGCQKCQEIAEIGTKVQQAPQQALDKPWESVSTDHFGPLRDGSYVLVPWKTSSPPMDTQAFNVLIMAWLSNPLNSKYSAKNTQSGINILLHIIPSPTRLRLS
ncbi:uncharacterized protein LOC131881686 [Tigriopus californicus]|uniref:uncharacterized protein LOC131881686 n=1 Tax=Tigriopus californicus TaxID=6832 RepID=UPI0027DA1B9D|nr:uncharacterized protein LOC131881686 [Tigriopus californicus]